MWKLTSKAFATGTKVADCLSFLIEHSKYDPTSVTLDVDPFDFVYHETTEILCRHGYSPSVPVTVIPLAFYLERKYVLVCNICVPAHVLDPNLEYRVKVTPDMENTIRRKCYELGM